MSTVGERFLHTSKQSPRSDDTLLVNAGADCIPQDGNSQPFKRVGTLPSQSSPSFQESGKILAAVHSHIHFAKSRLIVRLPRALLKGCLELPAYGFFTDR
jgi:hypothetical protein